LPDFDAAMSKLASGEGPAAAQQVIRQVLAQNDDLGKRAETAVYASALRELILRVFIAAERGGLPLERVAGLRDYALKPPSLVGLLADA
jgi:hypothetical protein